MAYAVGKFAKALCDRCGFEYKLHELREEWNNLKTCPSCFEPKAPQIDPRPVVVDPEALYKPRPNNDKEVGEGFVVISDANNFTGTSINSLSMNPSILGTNFVTPKMTGSVGTVTITT
jgi:NAD-dependent SIR2 family protein deacetylase|tara:strand:- start:569 stop:922 length:354 start_codon:yes stop_codon:yes gene_type:complete